MVSYDVCEKEGTAMPHAPVNDIELYFEEYGRTDGPPLLLVHGFSGAGTVWEPFLSGFADRFRVIVPDLRAHGRSSGALETIHHRTFALDLVGLLDHLSIERAHFIGHSSGGMSLLFVGTETPHRVLTLTLVNATYTFPEKTRDYMRQLVAELPNQEAIADLRRRHGPYHDENHWQVLSQAFLAFTENPVELPFRPEDLAAIQAPVLIMHGDRDEFFPVSIPVTMYTHMPRAELCILPRAGHDVPAQYPQIFLKLVNDFIDQSMDVGSPP